MRSSKWLVFIRSRLAGFDRSLTSTLQGALSAAQIENKLLRQKLELFLKRYFGGTRNEGLDPKQLELLLAGLAAMTTAAPAAEKPTHARSTAPAKAVRQPLPVHLETERVVLEPQEVQQQPAGWRKLGEEVTEELDWKPARFIKRLYIRPKYANADRIVIAPLPARLIEKGLPGAALLTQVIVGKYEDHLPLYRQEKIYRQRHGVNLSRQTLCGWVEAAGDWLSPIYRAMKAGLVAGSYLQVDETPIRYLDPDVKGKSQQGWLWTYSHPRGDVVFEWNISRSREGPREFLKDFKGKLQTDGYGVYESLARERGGELILIGCMAHARRGFHEALGEGRAAAWLVGQMGQLYAVEKGLREHRAGPDLRAAVRAWQSRPVLGRLRRALEIIRRRVLPKSLLGQAIDYTLSRWEALTRYMEDGRLEIDNNLCENAIRPTAIGKNYPQLSVMRRGEEFPFDMVNDDKVFRPQREGATRHNYRWSRKCRSLSEGFATERLMCVGVSWSSVCRFISKSASTYRWVVFGLSCPNHKAITSGATPPCSKCMAIVWRKV
jgi:transposase